MTALWPWLALAGLGTFHGINPAMGWLFAVALGLHRHSRQAVLLALIPIALGHALAIAGVIGAGLPGGGVICARMVRQAAGGRRPPWRVHRWRCGDRRRVRGGTRAL